MRRKYKNPLTIQVEQGNISLEILTDIQYYCNKSTNERRTGTMASRDVIDKRKLGDAISSKRKKLGLTQEGLAIKTGLSRSYIADTEGGRYTPSLNSSYKIAKALKSDLNFLLKMTEIQY